MNKHMTQLIIYQKFETFDHSKLLVNKLVGK